MPVRLNVGCGQAPSAGWLNYDNSPAVWLAKTPLLARLLRSAGLIDLGNFEFAAFCRTNEVHYASAARRIPHGPGTVDAIYSSHMIEHLERDDAWGFLLRCRRVLKSVGRPSCHPRCASLVHQYLQHGDADDFLSQMQFETHLPTGLRAKLKWLLFGGRGHHWMYDARSLGGLMEEAGLVDVEMMEPGQTRIPDPAGLDLRQRQIESIYLEARRP